MKNNLEHYRWSSERALIKRLCDILFSLIILVVFFPVYIIISLIIFFTIGAPIFYSQERIGKGFKPYNIYKFRTMKLSAENSGPKLALDDDERIIGFGKLMRKWRIDELPQFWNVLKGDMSIVGPRPERAFFVNQLRNIHPEYQYLFNVKPGITSMGMVKYGYASTLDEMSNRYIFDLDYIKQLSLIKDIKVLLKTIQVVLEGSGK